MSDNSDTIHTPDESPRSIPWRSPFRGSGFEVSKRILFLGFLILIMLIPLGMVEGVVQERYARKLEVTMELGEQWGPPQDVSVPILVIPYDVTELRQNGDGTSEAKIVRRYASFLPERSSIAVAADVEKRYRSIYEVPVFGAEVKMSGHFAAPDFSQWDIASDRVRWREASFAILLPGARALRNIAFGVGGKNLAVEAGLLPHHPSGKGLRANLVLTGPQAFDFTLGIGLNGRESIRVMPLGGQSEIEMSSAWPHPSFLGAPLPATREIDADGFKATWSINHLATGIPLAWRSGEFNFNMPEMETVGVALVEPGDVHQQTDRVVKYALLVVALTFGTVFVVGLLKRDRVHLVQYLLIGAALALFYLLLLSLAEQMPFGWAYAIASFVDIAIVGIYAGATIDRLIGWVTGLLLAALHGYMYTLLQMENYALLAGTIGLFALLILTMIVTRRIDWFSIGDDLVRPASR